ncbi:ATP phosphoribosyltransferase [Marinoscillum sp. 108]|jgi:ATP phosphoribosyltransferase|uniref:ATP phosphoribosyltransferase n=1 Tax=Marinoscillum luteum TaxID=861051 RepID=A0ABW7N7S5_9BACT|nr:ATP phosphoribosyltransferase [Marinoscillum sp. 108]VXD11076.1 ATP phosphoribosyltransferase [Marinoscillum sp. 108]
MSNLKVAIQKSGRLSEDSLRLFKECGIKFNNGAKKLKAQSSNFPIEFLFLRDDDIPGYVEDGIADIGIVGQNVHEEYQKQIEVVKHLGFSRCRLSLAVPREEKYSDISFFEGKNIATSYPNILKKFLDTKGITAEIHQISGSVEIAPGIGLAEGICDIVSSGSTLLSNGLKEVETVMKSEAVMVADSKLSDEKRVLLNQLIFRINSVLEGKNNKYVLLNAPNDSLDKIISLLPGMRSPTVLPLAQEGWSSIHSVINEDDFWENIEKLREAGAEGILVVPIEKMIK